MLRRPPKSPLFPHPPLSRSRRLGHRLRQRLLGRLERAEVREVAADEHPEEQGVPPVSRLLEAGRPGARELQGARSEEHTSELQSRQYLVCRLLLEKKKNYPSIVTTFLLMPYNLYIYLFLIYYFSNYYSLIALLSLVPLCLLHILSALSQLLHIPSL